MCAPNGALFYLLDCFVTLAMTVVLESLSLRASVATRGNPVSRCCAKRAHYLNFELCTLNFEVFLVRAGGLEPPRFAPQHP